MSAEVKTLRSVDVLKEASNKPSDIGKRLSGVLVWGFGDDVELIVMQTSRQIGDHP